MPTKAAKLNPVNLALVAIGIPISIPAKCLI